jgi:hypothetical protein
MVTALLSTTPQIAQDSVANVTRRKTLLPSFCPEALLFEGAEMANTPKQTTITPIIRLNKISSLRKTIDNMTGIASRYTQDITRFSLTERR